MEVISSGWSGNDLLDGYMAEVVFIDGLQLAADNLENLTKIVEYGNQ